MLVKKARHKSCKIVQIVCLKINLREKKGTQSEFNKLTIPFSFSIAKNQTKARIEAS